MQIKDAILNLEVIDVPQQYDNYDMVLVCSKAYRKFWLFKRSVAVRVEFLNGVIYSIERKEVTTEANSSYSVV